MRQIQIYQAITTAQILRYIKAAGTAKSSCRFCLYIFCCHLNCSGEAVEIYHDVVAAVLEIELAFESAVGVGRIFEHFSVHSQAYYRAAGLGFDISFHFYQLVARRRAAEHGIASGLVLALRGVAAGEPSLPLFSRLPISLALFVTSDILNAPRRSSKYLSARLSCILPRLMHAVSESIRARVSRTAAALFIILSPLRR